MSYPRRILVSLIGLSPQVLSETLYGLAVSPGGLWNPTEIHVITTATGSRRLRSAFGESDIILSELSQQLNVPQFVMPASNIHIPLGGGTLDLDDIATPAESATYADMVTNLLRDLTSDPQSQLHVSIAGGRKTMGFLLGYAFTLFARPQDRLSHVLVSEPFERVPDFLHPTVKPEWLRALDGSLVNAQSARVSLVDIPYVSLRAGLPAALLTGHATYEQTVAAARRSVEAPRLILKVATREVCACGQTFRLPPLEMALYALLARRVIDGEPALPSPEYREFHFLWEALIAREMHRMHRLSAPRDGTRKASDPIEARLDTKKRVYENLSRLKRRLNATLGVDAPKYLVHDNGSRPRLYSLRLSAAAIEID